MRPLLDLGNGTLGVVLTRGYLAVVDADDREIVEPYNWTAYVRSRIAYAADVSTSRPVRRSTCTGRFSD
jgi:hypothetical protein